MRIVLKLLFILFSLYFISCTKEIKLKEQEVEKRLVLNGLICPDSLISVRVSKTASILSSQCPFVDNATVKLFCDGTYQEDLQHIGKGKYTSKHIYPKENSIYTVQVALEGYPTITATDTVPQNTDIIDGSHKRGNTYDEYGDPHHDYEVLIEDKGETRDYYELFFVEQSFVEEGWISAESFYQVSFQIELVNADPVLSAEGDDLVFSSYNYMPLTYIFSDNYFNGNCYRLVNKFLAASTSGNFSQPIVPTNNDHYAILRTTTSAYYHYRRSWVLHKKNQQISSQTDNPLFMTFIGDPVPLRGNVENGYGIFAAYNQTIYKFEEQ